MGMNRVRAKSRIIKKVRFAVCEVEIAKNCYLKNSVNAVCRIFFNKAYPLSAVFLRQPQRHKNHIDEFNAEEGSDDSPDSINEQVLA